MSDEPQGRYVSRFDLIVEVTHDQPPDYLGDLLMADVQQALRARGCDPFGGGVTWRELGVPVPLKSHSDAGASDDEPAT